MFWKKRSVWIEVGFGEALDRLSILRIKCEKFNGAKKVIVAQERKKLEHRLKISGIVLCSYNGRLAFRDRNICEIYQNLYALNQELWDIEDKIRQVCECDNCSAEDLEKCSALARKVYKLNDVRSSVKKQINDFLGSSIMEIKDYRGKQDD